jgi:hypothetical protein
MPVPMERQPRPVGTGIRLAFHSRHLACIVMGETVNRRPGDRLMDIRPMRSWIHHSRGKALPLVKAAGGSAEPVVADATDESQTEKAVKAATADTARLDVALEDSGYDAEFPFTQDYSTDPRNLVIAVVVRGTFLPGGRHRGRAAADRAPDLWLPGQGQHRRPAVIHGTGKAEMSRLPSWTWRPLSETARERDAV